MRITDLVEGLELPPTRLAENAWYMAERRVRRRRAAGAAVTAAVVVVVAVAVVSIAGPNQHSSTVAAPSACAPGKGTSHSDKSSPRSISSGQGIVTDEMRMPPPYSAKEWQRLTSDPVAPPAHAKPLSEHPIACAVFAVVDTKRPITVFVMGPEREWRRVDVPLKRPHNADGYDRPLLKPTALSADASKLALPQPGGLVVVDVTDGSHKAYSVPNRLLTSVTWYSESEVGVSVDTWRSTSWTVNLADASVTASKYGPSTARAPDGRFVTWGMDDNGGTGPMEWSDGTTVSSPPNNLAGYNNVAGFFPLPPLVNAEVVVGHTRGGPGLKSLENGMIVVDRDTGNALAYLPTHNAKGDVTELLGWDGDRIVLGLKNPNLQQGNTTIAVWDWQRKSVEPVVTVQGGQVVWSGGW